MRQDARPNILPMLVVQILVEESRGFLLKEFAAWEKAARDQDTSPFRLPGVGRRSTGRNKYPLYFSMAYDEPWKNYTMKKNYKVTRILMTE